MQAHTFISTALISAIQYMHEQSLTMIALQLLVQTILWESYGQICTFEQNP